MGTSGRGLLPSWDSMAPSSCARLGPWLAARAVMRLRHHSAIAPRHLLRRSDWQGAAQRLYGSGHAHKANMSLSLPKSRSHSPASACCENAVIPSSLRHPGGGRCKMRVGRESPCSPGAPPQRSSRCRCLSGPAVAEEEGAPGSNAGIEALASTRETTSLPKPDQSVPPKPEPCNENSADAEGVAEYAASASAASLAPGEGPLMEGDCPSPRQGQGSGNSGSSSTAGVSGGRGGGVSGGRGGEKRVKLRRGQEVELVCDSLAFKGLGVCRVEGTGYVVLCERALPGERLIARISKSKQSFAEAYKLRTLTPHRHAADPPCAHFGPCGGCKLQNLQYHAQLAAKQQQVEDLMLRVGGFGAAEGPGYIKPIIGCAEVYHYRNKMEFSFGSRVWSPTPPPDRRATRGQPSSESPPNSASQAGEAAAGAGPSSTGSQSDGALGSGAAIDGGSAGSGHEGVRLEGREAHGGAPGVAEAAARPVSDGQGSAGEAEKEGGPAEGEPRGFALGLHAPKRFDKILPIDECHLQHPIANGILAFVRAYCEQRPRDLLAYDPVLHTGFLRHLTIRTGASPETNQLQIMVNLTTKADKPGLLRPLAQELCSRFPEVVSVLNTVNTSLSDVAPAGGTPHVLHGAPTISVPLRGLSFEVSASSFFQTNTAQAEVLYREVEAACALRGDRSEVVLDLFCGTGSIGLSLAPKVRQVYGYEIVPEAVADARRNARCNGITNAKFLCGDLNKVLPTAHQGQVVDVHRVGAGGEEGEGAAGGSVARPDVIITDPNRPGMHPKLLKHLAGVRAPRIVYVSCNPSTCARDMSVLCHGEDGAGDGPYQLLSVQPVDMFPHTPHIECVATLVLKQ